MKTIEKKDTISVALTEVLKWKEKAAKEIKGKTFKQKKIIYDNALVQASKILNSSIVKEPNGTYKIGLKKIN